MLPDRGPHLLPVAGPGLPGLPGLLCNRPRQQLIRGAGTFLLTPLAQKMLDAWGGGGGPCGGWRCWLAAQVSDNSHVSRICALSAAV